MNVVMEMFATILDVQVQGLPVDLSICGVCSMRLPREAIHHRLINSQLPRPTHHSLLLHIPADLHLQQGVSWVLIQILSGEGPDIVPQQVLHSIVCIMACTRLALPAVTIVGAV